MSYPREHPPPRPARHGAVPPVGVVVVGIAAAVWVVVFGATLAVLLGGVDRYESTTPRYTEYSKAIPTASSGPDSERSPVTAPPEVAAPPSATAPPATPTRPPATAETPPIAPAAPVPQAAPTEPQTAPPAADSGCHPSYDPCLPIVSDVDCAGGSGNGPVYTPGPVRVIGPDEYGLDRDRDGVGCE